MKQPFIIVIAGPNGVGKSTFAKSYLRTIAGCDGIIDPDEIARSLVANSEQARAMQAGHIALEQMRLAIGMRRSFAIETTLSGKSLAQALRAAREDGYYIAIRLLYAPSLDLTSLRVEQRVREGGHDIPTDVQRRRFTRSYENFISTYQETCHEWHVYDATVEPPTLLSSGSSGES